MDSSQNSPDILEIFTSCPVCATVHLDEGEWRTRPHSEHLCARCGARWTPLPCVSTRGVPGAAKYGDCGYAPGPFGCCLECGVPLHTSNRRCGRCAGTMAALQGNRVLGTEMHGIGLFEEAETLRLLPHMFCPGEDARCETWGTKRYADAGPATELCGEVPSRHFVRRGVPGPAENPGNGD